MPRLLRLAPTLGVLLFVAVACRKQVPERPVYVADDDPDMLAAIAKARETLPEFWSAYDTRPRGENDFSLKVKITDSHGIEHFWVSEIERREDTIVGVVNDEPSIVTSVKLGQRIEVPPADITDWLFMRGGKMVGNQTARAMFKSMTPAEVAQMKALMETP